MGKISEWGLALFESKEENVMVPEVALRLRGEANPPLSVPLPVSDVPALWQSTRSCTVYTVTSSRLNEELARNEGRDGETSGALNIQVDWRRAGKAFEAYLRSLLEEDETLQEQIEGIAIPASQAVATLGQLTLSGTAEGGRINVEGFLFQQGEKPGNL